MIDTRIELTRSYQSKRHVSRVQAMYERLAVISLAHHPRMRGLKSELTDIREALKKL